MKKSQKAKARRDYGGRASVTEIIGKHLGWKAGALVGWAHKLGREGRSLRERDEAADRGSCVHALVAAALAPDEHGDLSEWRDEQIEEAGPNAERVLEQIRQREWEVLAVERPIILERFAGTIDFVMRDPDGQVRIVDLKTGRGIYDEVVIQLAAYAWLWRSDCIKTERHEMVALHGSIIHAPFGAEIAVVDVDVQTMAAGETGFRHLLDLHEIHHQIRLPKQKKNDDDEGTP